MFYSVCNHIRHNGITETMFILIHNYWFAAMMQQVIFKVTAKIRGWKIYFNPFFRIVLLNKFQRRYEVAIGTHKDYRVCCIKNAICHHTDRDINICFLFFCIYNQTCQIEWFLLNFLNKHDAFVPKIGSGHLGQLLRYIRLQELRRRKVTRTDASFNSGICMLQ